MVSRGRRQVKALFVAVGLLCGRRWRELVEALNAHTKARSGPAPEDISQRREVIPKAQAMLA